MTTAMTFGSAVEEVVATTRSSRSKTSSASSSGKANKGSKAQSQKEKRRLKNRLSALASRKRKAAELDGLRTENKMLKRENEVLRQRLAAALAANEAAPCGRRTKKRKVDDRDDVDIDDDLDEVLTLSSATASTVSASTPPSPDRSPAAAAAIVDFSRIFEDDDGGADVIIPLKSMEKRSIDNDIDDSSNNNSNNNSNNSNNNSNNSNDKIFPNPVLGELGTQPAVFTDEIKTTPTTSATTSTPGTTKATSAIAIAKAKAKANSRLQSLRFRARRLQKKQWAKLQRLPLTHLVRVLHFSQSLLNLNIKYNPNPSLAHAAAEVPCVRP